MNVWSTRHASCAPLKKIYKMNYRREIDGLRALAVLPVILFHAGVQLFSGGFVGVDVFFVISGYLITTIIIAELEQGKFSIVNFYERRARRILPALFLVMLVCIPFAWIWLLPSDMKDFSHSLVACSVFASNILFWRESGYFDTAAEGKPLLHTWSLAVEAQFYVLFPLFLMLLWKLGKRWILLTIGLVFVSSLALAQWAAYAKPAAAFYILPTRGWELLIGVFAAFYLSKANRKEFGKVASEFGGWLGVALLLYSIFAYSKATPFPGYYALVPTLGTLLIILFATQQTTVGKFIGNKAFVGLGLISYSAYLWHQPLFAFARHMSLSEPSYLVFLLLSISSLVLAFLSWKYVEGPFNSKQLYKTSLVFSLATLMSLFFISVGYLGHKNNGFMSRINFNVIDKAPDMTIFEYQVKDCWQSIERDPRVASSCVLGNATGPLLFGLLGDSHAGSLLHVLNDKSKNLGIQGRNFSYRSCPPLIKAKPVTQTTGDLACYEFRKDFFSIAETNPTKLPKYLIVNARWTLLMERDPFNNSEGGIESGNAWLWDLPWTNKSYSEAMRSEIVSSIQNLLKNGKTVILIYPVPEMGWDVSRILARHLFLKNTLSADVASISFKRFLDRNRSSIEALDSIVGGENLIRIRPDKILCDTYLKERCVSHLNGQALYFDNNHLSNIGSDLVLKEVIDMLPTQRR